VDRDGTKIIIPNKKNAGWVIDGQHRLAGAHQSDVDIDIVVMAFLDLPLKEQIKQFVTINREAKGVPTSLYYDLLKHLPPDKTDSERAKERASDIADMLRKDEASPFFGRLVIISSPKRGELSLTNFVRKVGPLVQKNKGKFHVYSANEQKSIIDNYFNALNNIFPKYFDEQESVFFQTLGFGALMNALPTAFDLCVKHYQGFTVKNITDLLKHIEDFEFADWKKYGTGNAAEIQAGEDMRLELMYRLEGTKEGESVRL
jgi:DGQHR domain-containing protein